MDNATLKLEDITAKTEFWGEEATETPAGSFEVEIQKYAECLKLIFSREGEPDRQLHVEQQGSSIVVYAASNADTDPDARLEIKKGQTRVDDATGRDNEMVFQSNRIK
jgi:hypothetical protein